MLSINSYHLLLSVYAHSSPWVELKLTRLYTLGLEPDPAHLMISQTGCVIVTLLRLFDLPLNPVLSACGRWITLHDRRESESFAACSEVLWV